MKKNLIYFFLFFFLPLLVFAQAPDTVIVPTTVNGEARDALAIFILGDTTASGQRNNPNRVYKLQRGQIYYLIGARNYNFNLRLVGDGDESLRPPVVAPWPLQDGSIPDITMSVNGDIYVRNICFTGFAPTGQRSTVSGYRALALGNTSALAPGRLVIEKCIFEGFRSGAVSVRPPNSTIIMKDNLVRNLVRSGYEFAASFLFVAGGLSMVDTIILTNNTYFNGNNYFLCSNRNPNKYVRVEHNTVYINNVNPFFSYHLDNAYIKNNLFIATANWGQKLSEFDGTFDSEGQRLAIFSLEHLPSNYGIADADRKVELKNNVYWWPDKIKSLWSNFDRDSVYAPLWTNTRTDSIFANKTRYPKMIADNNLEVDPGFTDNSIVGLIDSLYDHLYGLRINRPGTGKLYLYKWEFPCPWPIPENFTYTNATLLTGGDDGLPVGDLNWYPDKKKEWEQKYETIDVEDGKIATIPTEFKLEQNYPNPFNPHTMISFHVPEKANVSLKVYDVLGKEVATLVNQIMEVGEHKVNFNASNLTTGVYFYQMKCNNFVSVKKMMLLK